MEPYIPTIISALSALFGAGIVAVTNYFATKNKNLHDIESHKLAHKSMLMQKHFENKTEEYKQLITKIHDLFSKGTPDDYNSLIKQINIVILYANCEVKSILKTYSDDLAGVANLKQDIMNNNIKDFSKQWNAARHEDLYEAMSNDLNPQIETQNDKA